MSSRQKKKTGKCVKCGTMNVLCTWLLANQSLSFCSYQTCTVLYTMRAESPSIFLDKSTVSPDLSRKIEGDSARRVNFSGDIAGNPRKCEWDGRTLWTITIMCTAGVLHDLHQDVVAQIR